jgi:DNA-binding MarR family transcriptional regulator
MTGPILTPQIVGQAENAHLPVLARILARTGTTKNQWVALSLATAAGGTIAHDQLAARITDGLKIDNATVLQAIIELIAAGMLAKLPDDQSRVRLTDVGQARHREIRSAVDEIIGRVYGDISADDLTTAGRVLALITTRLNAETANAYNSR